VPLKLYILILLSAFVIAFVLMPLVIKLAYIVKAVDRPESRKVHAHNMPRLGGMAIFISFLLGISILGLYRGPFTGIILGSCLIFLVGMLDDILQISAWIKLVGQIAAAVTAVYFGVVVNFVTNPFDGMLNLGLFSIPLTILWIVGITNAINLIDGLDGLAAGVSAIAAATMGIIAFMQGQLEVGLASLVLVAAVLGFLPYNFHPARTFMGDGGSNFLGFILACLATMGTAKSAALISLLVPLVILGIPILDTLFAIVRRINNRAHIFMPDKDHLHHRLMALGMSHRHTVLLIYAISLIFGAISVTLTFVSGPKVLIIMAFILLLAVLGADKIGLLTGGSTAESRGIDAKKTHKMEF